MLLIKSKLQHILINKINYLNILNQILNNHFYGFNLIKILIKKIKNIIKIFIL